MTLRKFRFPVGMIGLALFASLASPIHAQQNGSQQTSMSLMLLRSDGDYCDPDENLYQYFTPYPGAKPIRVSPELNCCGSPGRRACGTDLALCAKPPNRSDLMSDDPFSGHAVC